MNQNDEKSSGPLDPREVSVVELGIPQNILNMLHNSEINSLHDLVNADPEFLRRKIGERRLPVLEALIAPLGFHLPS